MDEPVRWVTKAEAAEELEISLSTLDRKIEDGSVYRQLRPTTLDKIKNFHLEAHSSALRL